MNKTEELEQIADERDLELEGLVQEALADLLEKGESYI